MADLKNLLLIVSVILNYILLGGALPINVKNYCNIGYLFL